MGGKVEIFISYAHADEELRQALERHLIALQKEGMISIWHEHKIIAGEERKRAIDVHFNTAGIILLLVSPDFIASEHCDSIEMQRAMKRHKRKETHIIPVILRPIYWQGTSFGHLQALPTDGEPVTSKKWSTLDDAFFDVAKGIREIIRQLPSAPERPIKVSLWNVPPRNLYFTGRETDLQRLHNVLSGWQNDLSPRRLAISGLGGVGKTQIVLEYVYRHYTDYKYVFWVRADSMETILADYMSIAREWNLNTALGVRAENGATPLSNDISIAESEPEEQTQIIDAIKRRFYDNANWLLILDNIAELAIIDESMPTLGRGSVLITSRMQSLGNRVPHPVEVDIMNLEEGMLFLLRRAGLLSLDETLDAVPETKRTAATTLYKEMDGLPLALDQAGAYIKGTGCSLSQYLYLYKRHTAKLLKLQGSSPDYPQSVATTWSLSFQKVGKANPVAAEILRICAFLHSDAIPENIFIEGKDDLGPILSTVEDDLALNDAIGILHQYSLVKRNAEAKTLTMHRLVQTVIRDSMSKRQQLKWAERAMRVINRMFPKVKRMPVDTAQWPICEQYLPHAQVCLILSEQYLLRLSEAAHLFEHVGCYLYVRGQYTEAEPFGKRALEILEQLLGQEHPEIVESLDLLAAIYHKQGKYSAEEPLFQRIISYQERTLGLEHPDLAKSLHGLGKCYYRQGKYAEAEPILQRARSIIGNAVGPENANILSTLGILYWEQGKYAKAEPLYQQAHSILEHALGSEHPDVANSRTRLGLLYKAQGRYAEAMPLYQRSLAILEKSLGPKHPNVAISLSSVANLYYLQEQYEEAKPLWQRALAIFEHALGPEHPYVGTTLKHLGDLASCQEKYMEAEQLLRRALAIHQKSPGIEHSTTIGDLYSLGNLYNRQKKYIEAEQLLQDALARYEKTLGKEHPEVAKSLINLGVLYLQQGKEDEARASLQRALTIQEKALGPEHPKTLATKERYNSLP